MPRYGDDQCAQCGGIRVAKSTLCADCLVATVNSFAPMYAIAQAKLKELEMMFAVCQGQLNSALACGFKQNQENAKLLQLCKRLQGIALRRGNDEKDGQAEDTDKG